MPTQPDPPVSFLRPDLERAGFTGWSTWDELREDGYVDVPSGPAVYVVYCPRLEPAFMNTSTGGRFKGRDPAVSAETLRAKWVAGAHVVYIGKADVAKRRLREFAHFGAGEPVGHWGGRYIWQLDGGDELLVAWHAIAWDESAREYEKRLMAHFCNQHSGQLPFANLTG